MHAEFIVCYFADPLPLILIAERQRKTTVLSVMTFSEAYNSTTCRGAGLWVVDFSQVSNWTDVFSLV